VGAASPASGPHRLSLRAGKLEAVVVDNHDGLGGDAQVRRRAALPSAAGFTEGMFSTVPFEERFNGYNGLALLRHHGSASPFVPALSGLNCEFVLDGRAPDYEPRWKSLDRFEAQDSSLEPISTSAARLVIEPGARFGVRVESRFELVPPWFVDVEHAFTPTDAGKTPADLLGVFWASYLQVPKIAEFFLRARDRPGARERWIGGFEGLRLRSAGIFGPEKGLGLPVLRGRHPLIYGLAETRYSRPLFCGTLHGMLLGMMFDPGPDVELRFALNATGAGPGCPAWDYQALVSRPRPGRRYPFRVRVVYKPFTGLDEALEIHRSWRAA
jgi:hypothetical protein